MNNQQLIDETITIFGNLKNKHNKTNAMRNNNFVTKQKKNYDSINKTIKLDNENEELKHTKISHKLSLQISQARTKMGLTRKQLSGLINKPVSVITDYESGKAIPDHKILNILQNKLRVKFKK